jgi:hypothetical protein
MPSLWGIDYRRVANWGRVMRRVAPPWRHWTGSEMADIAAPSRESLTIKVLEERQHVFATGSRQVPCLRHRYRSLPIKLRDDPTCHFIVRRSDERQVLSHANHVARPDERENEVVVYRHGSHRT